MIVARLRESSRPIACACYTFRMADLGTQALGPSLHVANIDYGAFYSEAFPSLEESRKFVDAVEATPGQAKILLHQVARMVWLADRLDEVAKGRPALQIMFYMIAAEAAAKLFFKFEEEGQSKHYARKFFADLCEPEQRTKLDTALYDYHTGKSIPGMDTVDFLYGVRCDVAHRGRYYDLHLPDVGEDHELFTEWNEQSFIIRLTICDLRRVLLDGGISASKKMIGARQTTTP